jgi:hypothetical protein
MAEVKITNKEKPTTFFGFKSRHFKLLTDLYWVVDVNFESDTNFYNYVWQGFNPEIWELKNRNYVLIKGQPYREYLSSRKF